MSAIRLWQIPPLGGEPGRVEVLDFSSPEALVRPARVGGRVFVVSGAARREDAERLLATALGPQPNATEDPEGWARVAAARARVVEVEVTRG